MFSYFSGSEGFWARRACALLCMGELLQIDSAFFESVCVGLVSRLWLCRCFDVQTCVTHTLCFFFFLGLVRGVENFNFFFWRFDLEKFEKTHAGRARTRASKWHMRARLKTT